MSSPEREMPPGVPFAKGSARAKAAGSRGGQVTAAARRKVVPPFTGTILDLMDAAAMTRPEWLPWRAFWKAVYALPMSADELACFQRHTQRTTPPAAAVAVAESWMCVGRGGGKTRNSALHAVFRAIRSKQPALPR